MIEGRILSAQHQGVFTLRFEGDVRLSFCTALDEYISSMFAAPDFVSVFIDLSYVEGLDSTTLGMIARIAVEAKRLNLPTPVIFSPQTGITRLLESMAFAEIFDIRQEAFGELGAEQANHMQAMQAEKEDESAVRDKVLDAHRTLAALSADNKLKFKELLMALGSDED